MKANELSCKDLMVGDWVRIKITQHNTKVTNIDANSVYTEAVFPIRYDEIVPISLTPDILKKNGFIYTTPHWSTLSEDKIWQLENSDIQVLVEIEAQTDDNLIEYYVGNFLRGANSCTLYFSYVHQLQHALRLCGINHEIIL